MRRIAIPVTGHGCERRPRESAAKHFRRCGPFCRRVQVCRECVNVFALCKKHRKNAGLSVSWRKARAAGFEVTVVPSTQETP